MGQGIATSYAQLAVDVLGVPLERVRIVQGDTDRYNGFGSAGSRSLFTGGTRCRWRRAHGREGQGTGGRRAGSAGRRHRVPRRPLHRGRHRPRHRPVRALAGRQAEQRIFVDSTATVGGPTWPNGCHICEVEIDPATGEVQVVAYASVNDIGRVVSPTIVRGQIDGGAVQGIGQALCERMATTAKPASCCRPASWTTRCRMPTASGLQDGVRHQHPLPEQPAGRPRAWASWAPSAPRRRWSTR
jgi:carbon-monoxide dehydrogenase large subunit